LLKKLGRHLSAHLNAIGIPVTAAQSAAIRQQLLEMPAPVVADTLLHYHHVTATRLTRHAAPGADTPGDHTPL